MQKKQILFRNDEEYLRLPFQYSAPVREITVKDESMREIHFAMHLSINQVDMWMFYPIPKGYGKELSLEASAGCWLNAISLCSESGAQSLDEPLRPRIHHAPNTGGMLNLTSLEKQDGIWYCSYLADPVSLEKLNDGIPVNLCSTDLVHWKKAEQAKLNQQVPRRTSYWCGDVSEEVAFDTPEGQYIIAKSSTTEIPSLAASSFLGLPAISRGNGRFQPCESISNLRVWERRWRCSGIQKEFYFEMRFRIGPDVWPEIKILEKMNTSDDIRTDACEVDLELFVGQEQEINIDFSGAIWTWRALTQTIYCREYEMPLKQKNGRIMLHFFSDTVIQELFANGERGMMIVLPDGRGKAEYKIKSDLVENINNESFKIHYYKEPYLKISSSGTTASIIELRVFGLRPIHFSTENQKLLKNVKKGKELYCGGSYKVYENCVEDSIYGEPPAWVLDEGNTVLSPVRAVEEFQWRETPWGDMTRIIDRDEKWQAPRESGYPRLISTYPVITAAYQISVDIMERNLSAEFALPGQKGLMNAALFQGPGEGFGIWVRDACHSAFRIQNLLAPGSIRRSLVYVSEHGFNNGVDCGAMPAIAIWDHYISTGDVTLLYETFPGIIRYAEEADSKFISNVGLVDAKMCPAQDAFEEPENDGFCLGTEILYAWMYKCAASICKTIDMEPQRREIWDQRGCSMLDIIKSNYWNEQFGCFTSGPAGSMAYENGWWEATGAELALWPRFEVANTKQTISFLSNLKSNKKALSDFGVNWYPFRTEKNHFWNACWVSWTLGISVAAAEVGDEDLLRTLIFQQIRNVVINKTFHEVIDNDTGRAWRWPGLPWHAAAFIGYIVYGIFGIRYDENGLSFKPMVPYEFRDLKLKKLKYKNAELDIEIVGAGVKFSFYLDGEPFLGYIDEKLKGHHKITLREEV